MAASNDTIVCNPRTGRGVLYIVWGDQEKLLDRSIASVRKHNPDLKIHVERLADGSTLLDKARMYDFTPFRETLFLDADTVVLGNLDYGFKQANRYGMALCINECPWALRYTSLAEDHNMPFDLIEYNTGVIFFASMEKHFFNDWQMTAKSLNSELPFMDGDQRKVMILNDQASFARCAWLHSLNPHVLPMNWNFRRLWHRSLFGPVKIWHDYSEPSPDVLAWNERQTVGKDIIQFARID